RPSISVKSVLASLDMSAFLWANATKDDTSAAGGRSGLRAGCGRIHACEAHAGGANEPESAGFTGVCEGRLGPGVFLHGPDVDQNGSGDLGFCLAGCAGH